MLLLTLIERQAEIHRLIHKVTTDDFDKSMRDFRTKEVIITAKPERERLSSFHRIVFHPHPGAMGWLYAELKGLSYPFWGNIEFDRVFVDAVDFSNNLNLSARDSLLYLLGSIMQKGGGHENQEALRGRL